MEPPQNSEAGAASIERMQQAWVNETNAPEILPYEDDLVKNLTAVIDIRTETVDRMEQGLLRELYAMEVDRIKYVIRAYLRARLHKLEALAAYQLSTSELRAKLSRHELDYARRYKQAFDNHMMKSFLASLPLSIRKLDEEAMISKPNLDTFVFVRITEAIGAFQVEEGSIDEVSLEKGDIFMMRYRILQPLLEQKKVQLL